jgi:ribokinase
VRVAVVGHVEWVHYAVVDHVPAQGEIVHAEAAPELPAGGGAVAAVQLARLAGECLFVTALGDDSAARRANAALERLGVRVEAAVRPEPQRRAFVHLDADAERTITVMGPRMVPHGSDPLPWGELDSVDAVYVTGGDAAAIRHARRAGRLVATTRALGALGDAGVAVDVLLASANDEHERYSPGSLDPEPRLVARTDGKTGGRLTYADGRESAWLSAPLPGPAVDSYGAGDSFAGGVTYGLAAGMSDADAIALGARCGAACVTGRGPYEAQLRSPD